MQISEYVSASRASDFVLYAVTCFLYVVLPIHGKQQYLKESFQNTLGVNGELMVAMQTSEQGVGSY